MLKLRSPTSAIFYYVTVIAKTLLNYLYVPLHVLSGNHRNVQLAITLRPFELYVYTRKIINLLPVIRCDRFAVIVEEQEEQESCKSSSATKE
jgi:hypothetical protein